MFVVSFGIATGCNKAPDHKVEVAGAIKAELFSPVAQGSQAITGSFSPHFEASRNGLRRDSMLLVAPVAIQAPMPEVSGRASLEGFVAPVYNIGDGILLEMTVRNSDVGNVVYSRYIDPGRCASDRAWNEFSIPLDPGNGKARYLELRVTAGPQGNLLADWLVVSGLRVVQRS